MCAEPSYYLLNKNIALRSWRLVPYAYYTWRKRDAAGLKQEEYELLVKCDGRHALPESKLLDSLAERGLINVCEPGEELTEWQKPRFCDNRYFPAVNWMITGKCNYNCLHCFNAVDNSHLQSSFTWEEAKRFIEEAAACGINEFTITGGEPMAHPHFLDIIREIYRKGMYVGQLNTNGAFIDQAVLDELKAIGCEPVMKISFDGIGYHDWLRNKKGAEKEALHAMELCIRNGFTVMSQTNVHRLNVHTMLPTAKLLNDMGVAVMRVIRTTESPRWQENAEGVCLELGEYYDAMLSFLAEYVKTDCRMKVFTWQFADVYPQQQLYRLRPVAYSQKSYRDSRPVCASNRGMAAVTAEGELLPCNQMSGYYARHNDRLGNVKEDGLRKHLQEGRYLCEVCTTLGELKAHNRECASCPVFSYCGGGCRVIATAYTGDKLGKDPAKCLYFKGGYVEKTARALEGYRCMQEDIPLSI
ncbi:MAG: radical SAM protein [Eubacteriales bacterium]|nr:radical SAM protein [Eubacteriales bacterium]